MQKYIVDHSHATLGELAEYFDVSERTIKRDIRQLNQPPMNAKIVYQAKEGGYRCENPTSITTLPLTDEELQALFLMRALSESLGKTPLGQTVQSALHKIQSVLPDSIQGFIDSGNQGIACFIDPLPNEPVETCRYLRPLMLAIEHRQRVTFMYASMSSRRTSTRTVDPYLLFFRRGRWYLRANCHHHSERRDFVVGRMMDIRVDQTHDAFTPPSREKLLTELGERFSGIEGKAYTVKIKFTADWTARIAERTWHPTQTLDIQTDGSCILTMTVEGLSTVAGWVMSFCGHAVPLAPRELVTEVKRAARTLFAARP
jgi:predicted DNA-binding transcriptional regulator YafY